MSSIDEDARFPDNPLSATGITIFVIIGVLIVGFLLVAGVNMLFPLRPPTLALRYLLPTWVVEVGSRFEENSALTWHRHHTVVIVLISLFYVIGPVVLARSLATVSRKDQDQQQTRSPWLTGLGIAAGSGLTFFALLGPLIALPKTLIDSYRTQKGINHVCDRTVLSADMEMMALKAQAIYHGSTDTLTAWAGDSSTPPISLSQIAVGEPILQPLLSGDRKNQRSYFVLSVLHGDTLLIYGKRGNEGTVFDRAAVMKACDQGDAPPGVYITPHSWKWTFG